MAKFSKLLGGDPAEYSPAQAGAAFAGEVSRLVKEDGVDITKAWSKAKLMHPETHARMCESANPTTAVANSGPAQTVPFGSKVFLLQKFWLPPNTSDDIFAAAYAANGYQAIAVNAQKVFPAVVAAVAKKFNCNASMARKTVLNDLPQLSRMAGEGTGASDSASAVNNPPVTAPPATDALANDSQAVALTGPFCPPITFRK